MSALLRPALPRLAASCIASTWLLAGALLVAGCAGLGEKLETPQVEVVGVQMLSADMFAQQFKLRLRVQNPNDLELPVRGIEYQLLLMGDSFAEGNSTDRFVLPANGEAEFDMLVQTNFVSSFGRLLSRMGGRKLENVDYELSGKIQLEKGPLRRIPFSHKGQVDFYKSLGLPKSGQAPT